MSSSRLHLKLVSAIACLLLAISAFAADNPASIPLSRPSDEIIGKYLEATRVNHDLTPPASMEVEITASVPKLQEKGHLRALRMMSRVGLISYRVLGFQGSSMVKSQVIARFLQAEQQSQGNGRLSITPPNYKFKLKGKRQLENGAEVYVFGLTPRNKELGTFKGEFWLDAQTYLPIFEKGRLVKNPSVFFKKVNFERAFYIQDGTSVPQRMNSTIDVRLIGTVQLDVSYSNYTTSPRPVNLNGTM